MDICAIVNRKLNHMTDDTGGVEDLETSHPLTKMRT
jgi:hypothetical protein